MKTHELAHLLLKMPDSRITVSTDVSTCDDDYDNRAFGDTLYDYIYTDKHITLIFIDGSLNFNYKTLSGNIK